MKLQKPIRLVAFCALAMLMAATAAPCAETDKKTPPATEEAPQARDPHLLRLAEILGALAYLQDLCKERETQAGGQIWRAQMTALLEAEGTSPARKERLAGAYNRGFRGYEFSYRRCTANALAIIARFLDESSRIAHEIAPREGSW
jgi:uncharacterized protein (TIGR02301 family)